MLDGLGAEGGEQRLVDGAGAPGAENGHQQFGRARQQAGHHVARSDAARFEIIGEARGQVAHLFEGEAGLAPVGALPFEGDLAGGDVAVATFHAGVDPPRQIAAQLGREVFQTECRHVLFINWELHNVSS